MFQFLYVMVFLKTDFPSLWPSETTVPAYISHIMMIQHGKGPFRIEDMFPSNFFLPSTGQTTTRDDEGLKNSLA